MHKIIRDIRAFNRRRLFRRRKKDQWRRFMLPPRRMKEGFHLVQDYPIPDNWEAPIRQLLTTLFPKTVLFVNCGANIGFYCCLAQMRGIKTIALEPEPINCQFLCKNLTINGFVNNVEVVPAAVGCPPPRITEIFGQRDTASLSMEFSGPLSEGKQFVSLASLDDILLRHQWMPEQSDGLLLLVDVESYEEQVLAGAPGVLALDPKPTWIIEILPDPIAKRAQPTRVFSMMFAAGYGAYRLAGDGKPLEVTQESVPTVMANADGAFWNYLFIDRRQSCLT